MSMSIKYDESLSSLKNSIGDYKAILNIVAAFFENAKSSRRESDPSRYQDLLNSEQKVWGLVKELFNSETFIMSFVPYKNEAKKEFFSVFNEHYQFSEEVLQKLKKDKLNKYQGYPLDYPCSDFELVNDIIYYDGVLASLGFILRWLCDIYESRPLSADDHTGTIIVDPDSTDIIQSKDADDLFRAVFYRLRKNELKEGQNLLQNKKKSWAAGILNGVLPYHDFFVSDKANNRGAELMFDEAATYNEPKADQEKAIFLDLFNCKEYQDMSSRRQEFYLKHSGQDVFDATIGNPNWLLSIHNFYQLSKNTESCEFYQRMIFAYASNNLEVLRQEGSYYDRVWAQLKTYRHHEVLRKFLAIQYLFRDQIPKIISHDEDFFEYEIDGPTKIYEKIYGNDEWISNQARNLKTLLEKIESEMERGNLFNTLIFGLIKARLLSHTQKTQNTWSIFLDLLHQQNESVSRDSTMSNKEKTLLLKFHYHLALVLRSSGWIANEDFKKIDEIIINQARSLIAQSTAASEVIFCYSLCNLEETIVQNISQYLSNIKDAETRDVSLKVLQKNLEPETTREIFLQIYQNNQVRDPLDLNEKIHSIDWLLQSGEGENYKEAFKLIITNIRDSLLKEDISAAHKLYEERLRNNKNILGILDLYPSIEYEIQCYCGLFDAWKSLDALREQEESPSSLNSLAIYENYKKITQPLFKNNKNRYFSLIDTADLANVALDELLLDDKNIIEEIKYVWTIKVVEWCIEVIERFKLADRGLELLQNVTDIRWELNKIIPPKLLEKLMKNTNRIIMNSGNFMAHFFNKLSS